MANFKLGDKFGIKSPFEDKPFKRDWIVEGNKIKKEGVKEQVKVIKVEGPFKDLGSRLAYVSRKQSYYYLATLNKTPTKENIKEIKWSVGYDDKDKGIDSFYLFSGGHIEGNKVKVDITINKGDCKYKIFAYTGDLPNDGVSVEANYKKVVTFFIGGAADKSPYLGAPKTNIVLREVLKPFDKTVNAIDYKPVYLGYEEVYGSKNIDKFVISEILDKEGYQVNIVGHSLGGWNGAHLSKILSDKGYKVSVLITLDPVGNGYGVYVISDIYFTPPKPICSFWINVYANAWEMEGDDYIALAGEQWKPSKDKVDIFHEVPYHHREAGKMFKDVIIVEGPSNSRTTASDELLYWICNIHLDIP